MEETILLWFDINLFEIVMCFYFTNVSEVVDDNKKFRHGLVLFLFCFLLLAELRKVTARPLSCPQGIMGYLWGKYALLCNSNYTTQDTGDGYLLGGLLVSFSRCISQQIF